MKVAHWLLPGASLFVASAVSAALVVAAPAVRLALLLCGLALVLLGVGIALRSPSTVAASSAPMLGAAIIEAVSIDEPSALRMVLIGCAWFVACELGWEAVEQPGRGRQSAALVGARVQEVAVVVAVTVAASTAAVVISEWAPVRTIALQAAMVAAIVTGFVLLSRRLAV